MDRDNSGFKGTFLFTKFPFHSFIFFRLFIAIAHHFMAWSCGLTQTMRVACAQKTTSTAIFKPVSRPTISQWRKADQPTQPIRVIPHVDCHIITILSSNE